MTTQFPVAPEWAPAYAATLIIDEGCNGPEPEAVLLLSATASRDQLELAWQRARADRDRAQREIPLPPRLDSPETGRFTGTFGQARLAYEQNQAELRVAVAARQSAARDAYERAFAGLPGRLLHAPAGLDAWGEHYQAGPHQAAGHPLAVVFRRGCSCGHGGPVLAEWVEPTDLTPPVLVTSVPEGYLLALDAGAGFPAVTRDPAALRALLADIANELEEHERENEARGTRRQRALALTADQVDALTAPEYVRWRDDRGRRPSSDSVDRVRWLTERYHIRADRLASHGLYLLHDLEAVPD